MNQTALTCHLTLGGRVRSRDGRAYCGRRAHHFFIKLKRATDHAIKAEFLFGAATSRFPVLRAKIVFYQAKDLSHKRARPGLAAER